MYRLTEHGIVRLADNAHIPSVEGNRDWQEYQEWLAAGNAPEPIPIPSVLIPQSVSMRQARLAMLEAGILEQVELAIADMKGKEGKAAQIEWEYAQEVKRDWPIISSLGTELGLDEAAIDNLFIAAGSIEQ